MSHFASDLRGDVRMLSQRTFSHSLVGVALAFAALGFALSESCVAKEYNDEETKGLLAVLSNAKLSLLDGVRQAAKGGEAPSSAKFELDDNKKLSLSVYTAEKGVGEDPEHNVLKELSGSPEQTTWTPESEVFKDLPHVSRASEH